MSRIDSTFARLKAQGKRALIAYLTVGFPSVKLLPELVRGLADAGVDLIELGVPFSDPLADGPTIQAASQWALKQGVTPARIFQEVQRLRREGVELPLVLMTYVNPVLKFGVDRFCRRCAASGVDGLIVPDLPPEEAGELKAAARRHRIDTIFLAAPTSPPDRLRRVARASTGFIYYVSLTGVTGARGAVPFDAAQIRALRRMTRLPVCVGFGVSGPAQVRRIAQAADGVIVGSALLDVIARADGRPARAAAFARKLRAACHA